MSKRSDIIAGTLFILMGTGSIVLAGLKVTEKLESHQLTIGKEVKNFKSHEECVAAVKELGIGAQKCKEVTIITVEGTCDDVPKPEFKLVLNAEGFLVLPELKVEQLADGSWGPTMEQGYVAAPYPDCWKLGLVPFTGDWHAPDTAP